MDDDLFMYKRCDGLPITYRSRLSQPMDGETGSCYNLCLAQFVTNAACKPV